jgi:hypothetical protein
MLANVYCKIYNGIIVYFFWKVGEEVEWLW